MTCYATIVSTLLLLQFHQLQAQPLIFGIRPGVVFTKNIVAQSGITAKYNKQAFLGGAHLEYQASKKLALRIGLEYITRTFESEPLHYIDIPLNVIYR